eukprot:1174214-Rhodomonas_salina.1
MQAYTVLYIMIMFLLIQNFLLAIIVEAYMKVRENNEKMKTHQVWFIGECVLAFRTKPRQRGSRLTQPVSAQEITLDVAGCISAYVNAWTRGMLLPTAIVHFELCLSTRSSSVGSLDGRMADARENGKVDWRLAGQVDDWLQGSVRHWYTFSNHCAFSLSESRIPASQSKVSVDVKSILDSWWKVRRKLDSMACKEVDRA